MLTLSIFSPGRNVFDRVNISEVSLTTSEGRVQVLIGHICFIGILSVGSFQFTALDKVIYKGVISSGYFEVQNDHVIVFADTIELVNEIDKKRAKKAYDMAHSALSETSLDELTYKKYQKKIERAIVRQSLFEE